jgi:2-phospho-L-lactate/phosphoenolpyruvate guanylyltransferase
MALDNSLIWSVVIPVKVLALAKSRLAGLDDGDRRALALAMAVDTTAAAMASPVVGAVVVVSDDPVVADELAVLGATTIADSPGAGLNRAIVAGAEHARGRWPGHGIAGLMADLPALRAAELTAALRAATAFPQAFVPDAAGVGTTLYTAQPGIGFTPRFGVRSRELHAQAGAAELSLPGIASLRQDVDTLEDLRSAAALGLGRRSASLALQLTD